MPLNARDRNYINSSRARLRIVDASVCVLNEMKSYARIFLYEYNIITRREFRVVNKNITRRLGLFRVAHGRSVER